MALFRLTTLPLLINKLSGVGEGVLSYRCIYRTVVDEESCFFNIDYRTNILNLDEIEEIRAGTTNLKMQIIVSKKITIGCKIQKHKKANLILYVILFVFYFFQGYPNSQLIARIFNHV